MSSAVTAAKSGTFRIGSVEVNRLGFGTMRLTGRGIWGPPADRAEAIRTLKRLPQLEVNFIDTADSYGPNIAEDLLRDALHPYKGIFIATKAGLARTGPDEWTALGRPEYLIQQAYTSCQRLGVERLDLWQLHRIDPKVPRDEQFGAIKLFDLRTHQAKNIHIHVSGDISAERLREARARGYHLLHKPVRPMALRAMLSQMLKKHEVAGAA